MNDEIPDFPPPTYEEALRQQPVDPSTVSSSATGATGATSYTGATGETRPAMPQRPHRVPPTSLFMPAGSAQYPGSYRPSYAGTSPSRAAPATFSSPQITPGTPSRPLSVQEIARYQAAASRSRDDLNRYVHEVLEPGLNPYTPWVYPSKFVCYKCHNTGIKQKNGLLCKDCWIQFGINSPFVSPIEYVDRNAIMARKGITNPNNLMISPGDPAIGGAVCGYCRGSGFATLILFTEPCPVCRGVGRVNLGRSRASARGRR